MAAGTALFPPDRVDAFVKPLLERLSRQFGDARYFGTHRDAKLHLWARARQERLIRGYGRLGGQGLILWDEGGPTAEERDLGFRFVAKPSLTAAQAQNPQGTLPDEDGVSSSPALWSIDPTTLDEHFKEPVMGLLDNLPWAEGQTNHRR